MGVEEEQIVELQQQVHQYQKILSNLHEGYILVDEDANIEDVNPAYCKMVGYSKEELLSMRLTDVRPGMSLDYQKEFIKEVVEQDSKEFETRHRRKDGEMIDLQASVAAFEKKGKIYLASIIRNVTKEKQEQALRELHRQQFESLFEHNPHAVFHMDLEGNYKGVNEKMEKLTGYTEEELMNLNFAPLITEEDLEKTQKHFDRAKQGAIQEYEIEGVTKHGDVKPVNITNFPIIVEDQIVGVFGIAEDITNRKEAERKLRESEERWQRLVEDNPQCVILIADDKIIYINKAGAELFGASNPEGIIGRSKYDFIHPDYDEIAENHSIESQKGGRQPVSEQKILDINGQVKDVLIYSVGIKYKGKDAIQSVFHDITERKRKEQLIKSSLEEKRVMLQEIHHRVKNNMAVISGLLELQAMNSDDEQISEILNDSQLRIHSMAMIHEKLYASKELSKINFTQYIKELSRTIVSSSQKNDKEITIRYQLDAIDLNVNQAIPCGLILNELIVNAFKHAFVVQETGTILVGLSEKEDVIEFWVEDNGSGLPDGFKIKNQESLGMKLIKTLTRQVDGDLLIEKARANLGTCFKITMSREA